MTHWWEQALAFIDINWDVFCEILNVALQTLKEKKNSIYSMVIMAGKSHLQKCHQYTGIKF